MFVLILFIVIEYFSEMFEKSKTDTIRIRAGPVLGIYTKDLKILEVNEE